MSGDLDFLGSDGRFSVGTEFRGLVLMVLSVCLVLVACLMWSVGVFPFFLMVVSSALIFWRVASTKIFLFRWIYVVPGEIKMRTSAGFLVVFRHEVENISVFRSAVDEESFFVSAVKIEFELTDRKVFEGLLDAGLEMRDSNGMAIVYRIANPNLGISEMQLGFQRWLHRNSVSVSYIASIEAMGDRYTSGCPNDDPPNNGARC